MDNACKTFPMPMRALAFLLSLVLVFALFPATPLASAAEEPVTSGVSGTCKWELGYINEGGSGGYHVLSISPREGSESGTLSEGAFSDMPPEVKQKTGAVTIDSGVKSGKTLGTFEGYGELFRVDLFNLDAANLTSTANLFSNCANLVTVTFSDPSTQARISTPSLTNMSGMFSGCTGLGSLNLEALDTSHVTDMSGMFSGCGKLDSLDLSTFRTSYVTDMSAMFSECRSLKELNGLSTFSTSAVRDMGSMFFECSSLIFLDVSSFDTSHVTNMGKMFSYCSSLTSLDLDRFSTSEVSSMQNMFAGCKVLDSLDLKSFDTSHVTNMSGMFSDCSALQFLDLSSFVTTTATNVGEITKDCISLSHLILGAGIKKLEIPAFYVNDHVDWFSMSAGAWFSAADIMGSRLGRADIYLKTQEFPDAEIIEGDGQVWTAGSSAGANFTSSAAFSTFRYVMVDDKRIDDSNYELREGPTIVTLKPAFLAALSAGAHTIAIVSEINSVDVPAKATFTTTEPITITKSMISPIADQVYANKKIEPALTIKNGEVALRPGTDYTVKYDKNIDAGTATVTVTGKNGYKGTADTSFTIKPKSLADASVTATAQTYTGSALRPEPTVKLSGYGTLVAGRDYTVGTSSYSGNVNAGNATVTVTGKGNYTGTARGTFAIKARSISNATVTLPSASYTYSGSAISPDPVVKLGTTTLKAGTDYTVAYANNGKAGTATVTITGKGNYAGTVRKNYTIKAASISAATVTGIAATYVHTGKAVTPKPLVKIGARTLKEGTDYALSYKNNVNAGTATVTITGKGGYTGTVTRNFTIKVVNGTAAPGGDSNAASSGGSGSSGSGSASGSSSADSPSAGDSSNPSATIVMYRLYNPNSGEHFYTASEKERDGLAKVGWKYEGEGWTAPEKSDTPVYRLYSGTDHHYTTSAKERDALVKAGWKDEGIGWYSDDAQGVPLYRQYNPNVDPSASFNNSGSHNYTTSKAENDALVKVGWKAEGIGWYGVDTSTTAPDTVYVTKSGQKYHRESCATTKNSTLTTLSLKDAVAKGYEPCSVCFH